MPFPMYGSALVAVDYLNRVPVVGLTGMMNEEGRSGEAAAALRVLARQHGWAVIAAAALKSDHFNDSDDLSALLGDERVPYEADRVLVVQRNGEVGSCGCVPLEVITLKDRTGPPSRWPMQFWGARFYPALEPEFHKHDANPLLLSPVIIGSGLSYWLSMRMIRNGLSIEASMGLQAGQQGEIRLDRLGRVL